MPEPGKAMRPMGAASSIPSLRRKGAALPRRAQSGLKAIWVTPRASAQQAVMSRKASKALRRSIRPPAVREQPPPDLRRDELHGNLRLTRRAGKSFSLSLPNPSPDGARDLSSGVVRDRPEWNVRQPQLGTSLLHGRQEEGLPLPGRRAALERGVALRRTSG